MSALVLWAIVFVGLLLVWLLMWAIEPPSRFSGAAVVLVFVACALWPVMLAIGLLAHGVVWWVERRGEERR